MAISKKLRLIVYEKCSGHCGYCGREIALNKMQVDHIQPVCYHGKAVPCRGGKGA